METKELWSIFIVYSGTRTATTYQQCRSRMFTGRFARDMESARVIISRRLFIVQESQWREFKMDSNEIVSSKFKYFSNVKDASRFLTWFQISNLIVSLKFEIKGATKPRYI
nr:hypothetical protein CFP56_06936 [Quercus suber]